MYVNYKIMLCLVSCFKSNLNFDFIYRSCASPTPFVGSSGKRSPTVVCSDLSYVKLIFGSQGVMDLCLLLSGIFTGLFILLCIPQRLCWMAGFFKI